jgi:two-component system cell cycle response regulator DivK
MAYQGPVVQKILVVEDNELNLKLFCDLLRAHGYAAEPVRDGREAIERARAFAPDLIVMDIQMPHISGLELIEQLKADEELRRTPIMAVTAYAAKGDEERIRDAGAEGYVSKPISVMKFVAAVASLLEAAASANAAIEIVGEGEQPGDGAAPPEDASPPAAAEAEPDLFAAEAVQEPEQPGEA